MSKKFKQGFYKPINADKYHGDIQNIVYRSSWERKAMFKFDTASNVVWWSSESEIIPYVSPKDLQYHRYFIDFTVCMKTSDNNLKTFIIEVKPFIETQPPKQKKKSKRYIEEVVKYGVNTAKWKAAEEYAKKKGYIFQILTERELNV